MQTSVDLATLIDSGGRVHSPHILDPSLMYLCTFCISTLIFCLHCVPDKVTLQYKMSTLVLLSNVSLNKSRSCYGDCLEVKRQYYQNSSVLDCVTHCSQSAAHLCEHFLQVKQIGFVTLGPYAVRRGGCLELYYCNMVEWFCWDSSLILTTSWFPSVL